jgi:hypothetical protein
MLKYLTHTSRVQRTSMNRKLKYLDKLIVANDDRRLPLTDSAFGSTTGPTTKSWVNIADGEKEDILSKILEMCILHKFGSFFYSHDLQLGFKKGVG